jgi:lysophospholipase L1-like esterase
MIRFGVGIRCRVLALVVGLVGLAGLQAAAPKDAPDFAVRSGLPNVAAKAAAGDEEVRVAFLGGSITAAPGWRVHALAELRRIYPRATFTEIFAAVPGTGSDYGAARVERDVLRHRPDLLFVEFAVNDGTGSPLVEGCMEGIVRQTWAANPRTDVCFVYTVAETQVAARRAGERPGVVQSMEKIAAHYAIPTVDFGVEVVRRLETGDLVFSAPAAVEVDEHGRNAKGQLVFTRDKVHPTPAGHLIYAERLALALPDFLRAGGRGAHVLPARLAALDGQRSRLVPLAELGAARRGDWRELATDDPVMRQAGRMAPPTMVSFAPGAAVEFRFQGTRVGLIGLKGSDNGEFQVNIDDLPAEKGTFFDRFSTPGRHVLKPWFSSRPLPEGEHRVRIELLATKIDKAAVMRTTSSPIVDPAPFAPHGLYLCGVLLVGELVEPPPPRVGR